MKKDLKVLNQRKIIKERRKPKRREPPVDFIRRHIFDDRRIGGEMTSALGRVILGDIRQGLIKAERSPNGIVSVPGPEFDWALEKLRNKSNCDEFRISLSGWKLPPARVYLGLNTFFVPIVYYYGMFAAGEDERHWDMVLRVEDSLSRMRDVAHLLSRPYRQDKRVPLGHTNRDVDVNVGEYLELLNLPFTPARREECLICREDKREKLTAHHIIGKAGFVKIKEDIAIARRLASQNYERGLGNFGRNEADLCVRCHPSLERVINNHMVNSTSKPNRGTTWVADLHILLAKKIAQYNLMWAYYDDVEAYRQILQLESEFIVAYRMQYGTYFEKNGNNKNGNSHTNGHNY